MEEKNRLKEGDLQQIDQIFYEHMEYNETIEISDSNQLVGYTPTQAPATIKIVLLSDWLPPACSSRQPTHQ